VRALVHSLERLNLKDKMFRYELNHFTGAEIKVDVSPPVGTQDLSSLPLKFRRRARKNLTTLNYQVSSSIDHLIHIVDAMGDSLVHNPHPESYFQLSSHYIVTVPLEKSDSLEISDEVEDALSYFTNNIKTLAANSPDVVPAIAVCLTKCDRYPTLLLTGKIKEKLDNDSGKRITMHFEALTGFYGDEDINIQVEYFATSAVGFMESLGRIQDRVPPNLDSNGWLKDTTNWIPRKVTLPFFWIIENLERQHLKKVNKKLSNFYIGYPIDER
jgi:hypothetical protein